MKLRTRFLPLFLLVSFLVLTGQGCGGPSAADQAATQPVTLTVWRVFDSQSTMAPIMQAYQALHPNVSFSYRQLRIEEYEQELLRAFAQGTGPDVFSVHNTWMNGYKDLIAPMPRTLTIPFSELRGTIRQERVTTLVTSPTITPAAVRRDFVDVVGKDVILPFQANPRAAPEERVWGLPLSVDTLALYYNRDLLNAAGVPEPPRFWQQFQETVSAVTVIGENDAVLLSGAALGTARNVERATDILALLMMQNGTPMTDERGRATFAFEDRTTRTVPGANATRFYTDFANPLKEVYSWNADRPSSFDAFTNGNAAMMLGYSYHLPLIRARAPRLNIDVAPMLQIEGGRTVNFANYWVETVAKSTPNQNWAWDFVQFAASAEQVPSYLAAAGKPTARRALINSQIDSPSLGAFVRQLLTAESWYRGRNANSAEAAILDLIDAVNAGGVAEQELTNAQNKVNQSL